ncbi:MAG: SUMF1/EgtB/PvdO family nonheme iron enzyme [Rhizobiaceae bacterium]|nr:SUMF1/EgtB/PvdO family nonheme iron enzyme [Rhizobiaceae bacterium]
MPTRFLDAAAFAAAVLLPLAASVLSPGSGDQTRAAEAVVQVPASEMDFPLPGEFLRNSRPAPSPMVRIEVPSFEIMRRQVGLAAYGECVAAGACEAADAPQTEADVPVTGVSWIDADAYARWYAGVTGEPWRLPTAEEMAIAAAERFAGEAFSVAADDPANPAVGWIRRYREEAGARRPPDPAPRPRGHYGPNSLGLEDFGGNVWEWTATCYDRTTLDPTGEGAEGMTRNCGVRVLEGRHRAFMSTFIRDGRSGGCAVGTPPENLGFRLVRDVRPSLVARLRAFFFPQSDPAARA